MLDQRDLADPRIALAKHDAVALGQPDHDLARPVDELGVGREHHRLRLNRGIDDHPSEVLWPHRLGAGGDRQALLQQSDKLLLTHTLAPARQRGAVEHQPMLEELLAAEELEIRVLNPTVAQHLVREVVHVFEDGEPRHQPRRQRRAAGTVHIDRSEPLFQEAPVDRSRQLH